VTFLGKGGGKLKGIADCELIINGFDTSDRIQEAHMAAIHMIIELVEYHLFSFPEVREEDNAIICVR
jgi:D-sedoheptulose 7-phosphate isomerase